MPSKENGLRQNQQAEGDVEPKVPRRAAAEQVPQVAQTADQPHTSEEQMPDHSPPSPTKNPEGMLDRSLQAQIGRQLRAIYSDVANEDVPDRFVRLLEALEAKEKRA